jgi:hypothetical protein
VESDRIRNGDTPRGQACGVLASDGSASTGSAAGGPDHAQTGTRSQHAASVRARAADSVMNHSHRALEIEDVEARVTAPGGSCRRAGKAMKHALVVRLARLESRRVSVEQRAPVRFGHLKRLPPEIHRRAPRYRCQAPPQRPATRSGWNSKRCRGPIRMLHNAQCGQGTQSTCYRRPSNPARIWSSPTRMAWRNSNQTKSGSESWPSPGERTS